MTATQQRQVAAGVATALLGGPWIATGMRQRVSNALGLRRSVRWVDGLVAEVVEAYRDPPVDRPRELAAFVRATASWQRRWHRRPTPQVVLWTPHATAMGRAPWPIADLPDLSALARLLNVDQGELDWFADVRGWERRCPEPLRHYRWRGLPKLGGGSRLVAAPKPRLKEIQRRVLRHVLRPIPLHDAAHGGVPGRSVRSALEPHAGHTTVIRMDLSRFYPSIPAGRIYGLLRTAGLPEAVAYTMTGLVTTVAPLEVSRDPLLAVPHLPQGAPTSPALANLIAYSLDRRLTGLAERFGVTYTRYVDDLAFSGNSLRSARSRFVQAAEQIIGDEGFVANQRKTVVLGSAGRQQVLSAVVNAHPAVPRPERDVLRAILHNCVVHGWASQARGLSGEEFRQQLLGRVAWVGSLHPAHGHRLRAIADRIDWA